MAKEYIVYTVTDKISKEVTSYEVNCAESVEESFKIPGAALFPVSSRYDENKQRNRAKKYAEYLNKLQEMANDLEKEQQI